MINLDVVFDDNRAPAPVAGCRTGWSESTCGYLVPDELPEPWREFYEECAAIREYDGGQAREHAEAEALRETRYAMRNAGEHCNGAP